MIELLSGALAVILEDADVLEAAVALQILDAHRCQPQELFDLAIGHIPHVAVMTRIFDENFMGANRPHSVV